MKFRVTNFCCVFFSVNANVVIDLSAKQINLSTIEVTWGPPVSPNGQVLAYRVSLTNAHENIKV